MKYFGRQKSEPNKIYLDKTRQIFFGKLKMMFSYIFTEEKLAYNNSDHGVLHDHSHLKGGSFLEGNIKSHGK
jgi:hypothetical protein